MLEYQPSPNFDNNRKPINLIVMHWFGVGTIDSAIYRFKNPSSQASAHYLISNDRVVQMVHEDCVAYHAGNYPVNQRSIGIEHDATLEHNASDETYETSARLIADICRRHSIPIDNSHITPHKMWSNTQCPGTLDLDRIIARARAINEGGTMDCSECKYTATDPEDGEVKERTGEWFAEEWVNEKRSHLDLKANVATLENEKSALLEQVTAGNQQTTALQNELSAVKQDLANEKIKTARLEKQLDDCRAGKNCFLEKIVLIVKGWFS